jgi:hypothetical protein
MIVAEPYQRDGRTLLRDLREASEIPPGYANTGLAAVPSGLEKLAWDGSKVVPIVPTSDEKLDRLALPPRVLAALVVAGLPAADTTAAEKTWAHGVLLDARDRFRSVR